MSDTLVIACRHKVSAEIKAEKKVSEGFEIVGAPWFTVCSEGIETWYQKLLKPKHLRGIRHDS